MRVKLSSLVLFLVLFLICIAWLIPAAFAQDQEKFETPEQTNEKIHQLATTLKGQSGEYRLGSGDKIKIDVFDVPELSRDVRVSSSGYISLPLIPVRIRAAGLTPFQLEEKLTELLQSNQLVTNPHVSVFLEEQHNEPIMVIGAVGHPTLVPAIRPATLIEVLSDAGGVAPDAANNILVTRGGRNGNPSPGGGDDSSGPEKISVNLTSLLDKADPKENIMLYGGDVVTVPRAGIVYVLGAVSRPGGLVLQTQTADITTMKALAFVGGTTGSAKGHKAVIVRKVPGGNNQEIPVDLVKIQARQSEDVRLYPNDILYVPDSTGKKALRRTGEIVVGVGTGVTLIRLAR